MAKKQWDKEVTRFEYNAYGAFYFGKEISWGMIGLLATYITDVGISAATAAIVLLIPKVWDAINDPLFGIIVDRVKLKNGQKYLPWMKFGTVMICICLIGMLSVPLGIGNIGKAAWIVVAYVLFDTGFTMVAIVMMAPLLVKAQERVENKEIVSEGIGAKEMLNYLKKNNQLYIVLITTFTVGMTSVDTIISLQVARICWGNESFAALLMLVAMVPTMALGKAIPSIIKKFDKVHVFAWGCIVSSITGVLMFLVGTRSLPVYLVLSVFKGCGMVSYQIIAYMFVSDTVEYAAYRTGTNASGISFALLTFCNKLRGALVTSFALALLGAIGFVSGEGAVQSDGLAAKLWGLSTLIPAAGFLIVTFLMLAAYKLRDKDVQVMSDYNNGKISKEEADRKLEKRYGAAAVHGKE